jgi:hypothetical protein
MRKRLHIGEILPIARVLCFPRVTGVNQPGVARMVSPVTPAFSPLLALVTLTTVLKSCIGPFFVHLSDDLSRFPNPGREASDVCNDFDMLCGHADHSRSMLEASYDSLNVLCFVQRVHLKFLGLWRHPFGYTNKFKLEKDDRLCRFYGLI